MGESDDAVGHFPAGQTLLESLVDRLLDGAVEREQQGAEFANIADTAPRRGRLDPKADRRVEGIPAFAHDFNRLAGADRALDADRPTRTEGRAEAILPQQRLRHDFLLHLAVETDRDLPL